jgi:hypothetical protein
MEDIQTRIDQYAVKLEDQFENTAAEALKFNVNREETIENTISTYKDDVDTISANREAFNANVKESTMCVNDHCSEVVKVNLVNERRFQPSQVRSKLPLTTWTPTYLPTFKKWQKRLVKLKRPLGYCAQKLPGTKNCIQLQVLRMYKIASLHQTSCYRTVIWGSTH